MVSRFKKIPSFAGQKNARKFTLYFSQKGREYAQDMKKEKGRIAPYENMRLQHASACQSKIRI